MTSERENQDDDRPGGLLTALHRIQDEEGCVNDAAIARLAAEFNLSHAELVGVIGFYDEFRRSAPAPRRLHLCRAESCLAMGGADLAEHARRRLAGEHGTALEDIYCLGNCACAPAVMLDGILHGRVDAARLDALLAGDEEA